MDPYNHLTDAQKIVSALRKLADNIEKWDERAKGKDWKYPVELFRVEYESTQQPKGWVDPLIPHPGFYTTPYAATYVVQINPDALCGERASEMLGIEYGDKWNRPFDREKVFGPDQDE